MIVQSTSASRNGFETPDACENPNVWPKKQFDPRRAIGSDRRRVGSVIAELPAMTKGMRKSPALGVSELLDRSAWYAQLDAGARREVTAAAQERAISAGSELSHHGGTATHWYGMLEGLLKWSTTARDGRAVTLGGFTTGSWFGEGSLLHGRPVAADIVAIRHSRVAMIPKDVFLGLRGTQLAFNHYLLDHMNERLHWFMGDFAAHRLFSAEAQVARALYGLLHPELNPHEDRHLEISQEEIANLAGLSRQRCNLALSHLRREALIELAYGCVTVIDLVRLSQVANG
jgi:CRP/FNR family cyclic AMP-dependent transcriptional regulator